MRLPSSSSAPWTFWVLNSPSREAELPVEIIALAAERAGYAGDDTAEAAEALIAARAGARAAKDWAVADAIRDALGELGLVVEDTPPALASRRNKSKGWVACRFRSGGAALLVTVCVHKDISSI